MWKLAAVVLVVSACDRKPADPDRAPAGSAAPANMEAKLAADIAQAVDDVTSTPPEAIPEAAKQAAVAPTALLGTWQIKQLISIMDGKPGEPTPPIVDGSWVFADGGRFLKHGGNELEGTFVLTKDKLVIAAIGPALTYTVDKLTATELVVTQWITGDMGTTTVLARAK